MGAESAACPVLPDVSPVASWYPCVRQRELRPHPQRTSRRDRVVKWRSPSGTESVELAETVPVDHIPARLPVHSTPPPSGRVDHTFAATRSFPGRPLQSRSARVGLLPSWERFLTPQVPPGAGKLGSSGSDRDVGPSHHAHPLPRALDRPRDLLNRVGFQHFLQVRFRFRYRRQLEEPVQQGQGWHPHGRPLRPRREHGFAEPAPPRRGDRTGGAAAPSSFAWSRRCHRARTGPRDWGPASSHRATPPEGQATSPGY